MKTDVIRPGVGFLLTVKIGDRVEAGQPIGEVHVDEEAMLAQARHDILAAVTIAGEPAPRRPLFYATIDGEANS